MLVDLKWKEWLLYTGCRGSGGMSRQRGVPEGVEGALGRPVKGQAPGAGAWPAATETVLELQRSMTRERGSRPHELGPVRSRARAGRGLLAERRAGWRWRWDLARKGGVALAG